MLLKMQEEAAFHAQVNQFIVGGVYPSSRYLNSSRQRDVHSLISHQNVYIIEFGGPPDPAARCRDLCLTVIIIVLL